MRKKGRKSFVNLHSAAVAMTVKNTYWYTLALDAIHLSEWSSQIGKPCRSEFFEFLSKMAFCKDMKKYARVN